jgi:hypothetical protein
MTVTLNLTPDVEAGLLADAQAKGLSLEAYLEQVVREQSRAVSQAAGKTPGARPAGRKSLAKLFAESPLKDLGLHFGRDADTGNHSG